MAPITLTLEIIEADDLQQVILDIIQNAIQPNTDGHESILAAAQAIDDLFPDRCFNEGEQRTAYSFLFRLWEGFPGFAKQIPYDSEEADRLVSLVRTLAKEIPPRHIRPRDSYGDTLWDGLPELIDALDENIGTMESGRCDCLLDLPHEPFKQQRVLGFNAFVARLDGEGLCGGLDWQGIIAVSNALEGVIKPIRGSPDLVDPDPRSVPELPFQIARAALWIRYKGQEWYSRGEWGSSEGPHGGPLWKKEIKPGKRYRRRNMGPTLGALRWKLWKDRFGVVRDCEGVDEATKWLAGESVRVMETIENMHAAGFT